MSTKPILTPSEREFMLANALRALVEAPSEHNRAWAVAALARYDYDIGRLERPQWTPDEIIRREA